MSSTTRGLCALAPLSLALAALLGGTVPAVAAGLPASPQSTCAVRNLDVSAQQTQGLPGQFQVSYSARNKTLWVAGSHGGAPNVTGTLASVDPQSLRIRNTITTDVVDFTGKGASAPSGKQLISPYSVAADDTNNTVWVTNTRTNNVTAYDQSTLKKVFSTADLNQVEAYGRVVGHPREVRVDATGQVYVGVRGVDEKGSSIWVFDGKTFALKKILEVNDPAKVATGSPASSMNFVIDRVSGRAYVPENAADSLAVLDTRTLEVVQRIPLHVPDRSILLGASDVALDRSLNELYVTSQGDRAGKNSGLGVYDLATGAFKQWIPLGKQTLAVDNDETRDLIYTTDFVDGGIRVIDARSHRVVSVVAASKGTRANDVAVAPDGTVFAADKSGNREAGVVPFTIDYATGAYAPSATETKGGADGKALPAAPITADTLYRLQVSDSGRRVPGTAVGGDCAGTEPALVIPSETAFQGYGDMVDSLRGLTPQNPGKEPEPSPTSGAPGTATTQAGPSGPSPSTGSRNAPSSTPSASGRGPAGTAAHEGDSSSTVRPAVSGAPAAPTQQSSADQENLASTGARELLPLAGLGLVAVLGGAGLVLARRRRV